MSSTSAVGIYAFERSNLTIRNGTVAYCAVGIQIVGNNTATTNSVDEQLTNMRVTYCNSTGIDVEYSPSSVLSGCQVSKIGATGTTPTEGINVNGSGVVVQGCTVSEIQDSTGDRSYAIYSDVGSFTRQCQVSSSYYGIVFSIYQDNLSSATTDAFEDGTDAGGNVSDGSTYTADTAARTSNKMLSH